MRFDQLNPTPRSLEPRPLLHPAGIDAHVSRRRFLLRAGSAAAFGAAATAGLAGRRSANAAAPGIGNVVPIPYGFDFLGDGSLFHVEAPPLPGLGDDPSTVYNFRGDSAIGFIDGEVDRTNRKTGEVETLPFVASDMRFMQGLYRGRDGKTRPGTFGFV